MHTTNCNPKKTSIRFLFKFLLMEKNLSLVYIKTQKHFLDFIVQFLYKTGSLTIFLSVDFFITFSTPMKMGTGQNCTEGQFCTSDSFARE